MTIEQRPGATAGAGDAPIAAFSLKLNNTDATAVATAVAIALNKLVGRSAAGFGEISPGTLLSVDASGNLNVTLTEGAIKATGNFLRYTTNGDGSINIILTDDSIVESVNTAYALPGVTISGVETLPAANTVPHGTSARLHQDNFVGAGACPWGAFVIADAVNNKWDPDGPQVLFSKNFGTVAAPTLTLTSAGKFTLDGTVGDPVIPGGLMSIGHRLKCMMNMIKTGTTTPIIRGYLGTDQSTHTNNSYIYNMTMAATANLHLPAQSSCDIISATKMFCSNRAQNGGIGVASSFIDSDATNSTVQIASAMKFSIGAPDLASDTLALHGFSLIWGPRV